MTFVIDVCSILICYAVLISYLTISDALILLTLHYKSATSQSRRDEYTADRKYYKSYFGLTAVPTDIPTDALSVEIDNNRITKIEANAFSQLSQCTRLSLLHNQISEVEPGAFNGLIALNLLSLESNQITALEVGTFDGLTALEFLYLDRNRLEKINANIFSGLKRCTVLRLNNNRIGEIESDGFAGLRNVTHLFLLSNRLTMLKVGMFNGLVVDILAFRNNDISSIEDYAFANLKMMRSLSLGDNALKVLSPGMFSGLDSLEILDLNANPLTTLPAGVFNHLPRPLTISITLHDYDGNTPLQCDAALCWLRQEELQGTIVWHDSQPICANEIEWSNWSCHETGKLSQATLFALSNLPCFL